MKSSDKRWNIGTVTRTLAVLVLAFITVGLFVSPVLADRDRRGDRGRYERGWQHERHGHYYWHGTYYDYPPPGYYICTSSGAGICTSSASPQHQFRFSPSHPIGNEKARTFWVRAFS